MFKELFNIINTEISNNYTVKSDAIANAINTAIEQKIVERDSQLPSVNEAVRGLFVARTTIVKAYEQLIDRGLVESRPRHGYFVISEDTKRKVKVMLLLHSLNPFQEQLYNAFEEEIKDYAITEVFFHHCNIDVFKTIVLDKQNQYGLFIITPFQHPLMNSIIKELPKEKVLIIDQLAGLSNYSYICQNFYKSVINSLHQIDSSIKKYKKGILLFPKNQNFPIEIKNAFVEYANKIGLPLTVELEFKNLERHIVYFVLSENDLVKIVKEAKNKDLKLGKDVGVLSYNDTPAKEIIADGISVITTDFNEIGRKAAVFVKNRNPVSQIVETKVILRNSF